MSMLQVLREVAHLQEVLSLSSEKMKKEQRSSLTPEIIFWSSDLEGVIPGHNDPWSSPHVMANVEMKKVFVD